MLSWLMVYSLVLVGYLPLNSIQTQANVPRCLNEEGLPVDWYIAYKFPELSEEAHPFNTGYAYAYITSGRASQANKTNRPPSAPNNSFLNRFNSFLRNLGIRRNQGERLIPQSYNDSKQKSNESDLYWTVSDQLITNRDSIVLRTLSLAYEVDGKNKNIDKINSVYYNDAPVEHRTGGNHSKRTNSQKAHAKGVLLMDDITGRSIWLTHSTPHFPPPRSSELRFLENSRSYGQTFMCISFDLRQSGKQIVEHLINMHPLVYDSQISDRLRALIPDIHDLGVHSGRRGRRKNKRPASKLAQKISTTAGENLLIYSKSADFGEDLYSGWIDSELKTALYVESWRNGAGTPLNSSCPRDSYNVNNVQDLKVTQAGKEVTWSYHQDHSKWAISENEQSSMVCISDINRMQSQFKRGGGAVCIKCPSCWTVFSNTILDLEPCPVKKKNSTISNQKPQ